MTHPSNINLLTTIRGSLLEDYLPRGWDLARMDQLAALPAAEATARAAHWHDDFQLCPATTLHEFEVEMGLEIAATILQARNEGKELAMILPVGPMGMYRWACSLLARLRVDCDHVHTFNMDEWSDAEGNTLAGSEPGSFEQAMNAALFEPLGRLTVPPTQRRFATREVLPGYAQEIDAIRARGGQLAVVYGIGRVMHIAFWEPHFAAEYSSTAEWAAQPHRIGAKLHPLTVEQNALTSFRSRTTLVPAFANTVGPGLFLAADYAIGGADGSFGRGMQWQGLSLKVTLQYGPDPWVPSSFMPTLPGRLFYLSELVEPLEPECN